jgi:hypothetical protein|tara:strand:+ start:5105 stop:6268 length:1164 start_codon:yes stop_codon:yes gene_type:complete
MANVLTDLAADIYVAADVVGRELVGFIPAVTINANGSERAAVGDVVRAAFTREATVGDVTESMTIPQGTDQTVDNKTLTINKSRAVQIPFTGEDVLHLNNGVGYDTVYGDMIAQAMRALTNEMEVEIATQAKNNASRAFGTAGTTPFASNFNEVAEIRQILVDNGMPPNDGQVSLVLNTLAGTNLRQLASLQSVNQAGNDTLLRQGTLLDLQGLAVRESAQVQAHTKGAGTGYDINQGSGEAIGETTITLDGGTVNTTGIKAGDIVTFAGDTNKYVVNTGLTATSGDIVIGSPGLRLLISDAHEMTIGNNYTGNMAFHRRAIELAVRAPAVPEGGDNADDAITVQDPNSGIVYEVRFYKGYRKAMIEVAVAFGVKAWKSDFIATLLG